VEDVEDPNLQINLEAARKIAKKAKLGDIIGVPVEPKKFGRIAAQSAKQVIIQGIREAERGIIYDEFNSKEHEILTGVVTRVEPRNGSVSIRISSNSEFTEAMLAPNERIKTEALREGDHIKVYVVEVRNSTRGPQVLISRTHPGLVKRLFELEVPEIFDGTVEIKSIAREAGSRTKMAVWSTDAEVDPIGACVGPKGGRVASIVNELGGEKIDIVKYSEVPEEYVAAALSPSEVVSVTMQDDGKSCRVIVPDGQLSLAIGKEGQNARLAAKLTGYKIDIKPESEAAEQ
jgi:N utilization substance protein A